MHGRNRHSRSPERLHGAYLALHDGPRDGRRRRVEPFLPYSGEPFRAVLKVDRDMDVHTAHGERAGIDASERLDFGGVELGGLRRQLHSAELDLECRKLESVSSFMDPGHCQTYLLRLCHCGQGRPCIILSG